jgi:hypothetical protein
MEASCHSSTSCESDSVNPSSCKSSQEGAHCTRGASQLFGLDGAICNDDAVITGSRLPTCLQVLRCMMYHCNSAANMKRPGAVGATSRFTTAKLVLEQVATFYEKANIPMVTDRRACEKIVKLLDANNKLRSITKDRRGTAATQKKMEEHQKMLQSTFQLWPPDAERLIKNDEDRAFLQSMKTDRAASFGSFDKKLALTVQRRHQRDAAAAERAKRARCDCEVAAKAAISTGFTSSDDSDCDTAEQQETTSGATKGDVSSRITTSRRKKQTGTSLYVPPNVRSNPNIVSMANSTENDTDSPTQQAAFTQSLISECGGDVSMVAASYAVADRSRRKVVGQIVACIHEEWNRPKLCTLHWDSKLTPTLTNHLATEERVSVLIGDSTQVKLLGVPSYHKATDQAAGAIIAELTMKLMTEWKCSNNVVNMAFDTTSANTGHLSAACIAIQGKLQRAVLWSGCRHHIGEVVISHIFTDLKIEASKSPDVTLFTRLRSNWDLVAHSSGDVHLFQPPDHSSEAQALLKTMADESIACISEVIDFVRDDYAEFSQLTLIFLGASEAEVKFR